jgi:hypothetical protein
MIYLYFIGDRIWPFPYSETLLILELEETVKDFLRIPPE